MTTVQVFETNTTIAALRREVAARFRAAGLDTPELDARVLIGHALGLDHTALAVSAERVLEAAALARIADLVARRLRREPVARIVGSKEFWGMPLALSAATLVPRPDTETLVELALNALRDAGRHEVDLRIADLGVGSGAILLALLKELPNAVGIGTDVNAAALVTARENAWRSGLADRAMFVATDYACALNTTFDLIVSNPPYVANGEIAHLEPEVRDFDPREALDGGYDGLTAYRAIAAQAPRLMTPEALLIVEIADMEGVSRVLASAGFQIHDKIGRDLAGRPRALCAQRRGGR